VEAEVKREDVGGNLAKPDTNHAEAKAAWENPLIPNARLREIYLAMARMRALEKALPAAKRVRAAGVGAKRVGIIGLEAYLVSATSGLGPGDLVSDALTGSTVDYLRGPGPGSVRQHGKAVRFDGRGASVRKAIAQSGVAGRLPSAVAATERIWAALGAAAALKTAAERARAKAKIKATTEDGIQASAGEMAGIVVVYIFADDLTDLLWKKCLRFSSDHELPVIFIVIQFTRDRTRKSGYARAGSVSAKATHCGVPAILVDADDAVAIYRVAQESIGHARIGGGPALLECVSYELKSAGKHTARVDAVAGLERYLLQRGVVSKAWIEREAKRFAKQITR